MNENRRLAHVERVAWLRPIEGADKIELAGVLGWQVVVKKDEFQVGDLCIYIEIDSKLPDRPEFEFMRSRGFKVKTVKLRGALSQGLVIHPTDLGIDTTGLNIGDDMTSFLGVTHIQDESVKTVKRIVPRKPKHWYDRLVWKLKSLFTKQFDDHFPSHIVGRTDEERIENLPHYLTDDTRWEYSEKLDGTSTTFALEWNGRALGHKEYYICSRNRRIPESSGEIYAEMFRKYDMRHTLQRVYDFYAAPHRLPSPLSRLTSVAIQGETIGEGIQGNPYKLTGNEFYIFNIVLNGADGECYRLSNLELDMLAKHVLLIVKTVPLFETTVQLTSFAGMDGFKAFADGKSVLNPDTDREGLVFRDRYNPWRTFKNVSNKYLLKHG